VGLIVNGGHGRHQLRFDEKRIDAMFAALDRSDLPGAAVGISVEGRPVYRKAFGLANMELPVALSTAIRMRIGSTSKHFTALAYMLLCEDGLATIDDPIGRHLPELHAVSRDVTMRQLMSNTSGLRDVIDLAWQFSGMGPRVSAAALLSQYQRIDDVSAPPGRAWIYNNGGWMLVGAAVERLSGMSLDQVLRERIFDPIGMYETRLRRWDDDFLPNSATLHVQWQPYDQVEMGEPTDTPQFQKLALGTEDLGQGGIVSTIDDMLRWLAHMDSPVVGSEATWALMQEPVKLANGTCTGYGFGLFRGAYRGLDTMYHSGGVLGGTTQMLKVPSLRTNIIVITNRSDVLAPLIVNRMLDEMVSDLDSRPVDAKIARPAVGVFAAASGNPVVQLIDRDHQQFIAINGAELPAAADADNILWPSGIWEYERRGVCIKGEPKAPTAIAYDDYGTVESIPRAAPCQAADEVRLVGTYGWLANGTELEISRCGDRLEMVSRGPFGTCSFALDPIAERTWRANPVGLRPRWATIVLDQDGKHFTFSSLLNWSVRFARSADDPAHSDEER